MHRLDAHFDQAGAWAVLENASGSLAFDVGANIGQSTKVLARGFKKVVAFEPCQESYDILAVEMPHNVQTVQAAVSSESGQVTLQEAQASIQTGQLVSHEGLAWGPLVGTRTVTSHTLADLVDSFGQPDFVKIDTEGHEVEIVKGGVECLSLTPHMIIEIHKAGNDQLIMDLLTHTKFTKLEHDLRISSPVRQNHFWIVGTNG